MNTENYGKTESKKTVGLSKKEKTQIVAKVVFQYIGFLGVGFIGSQLARKGVAGLSQSMQFFAGMGGFCAASIIGSTAFGAIYDAGVSVANKVSSSFQQKTSQRNAERENKVAEEDIFRDRQSSEKTQQKEEIYRKILDERKKYFSKIMAEAIPTEEVKSSQKTSARIGKILEDKHSLER